MSTDHGEHGVDGALRAARLVDDLLRQIADDQLVVLVTGDGPVARAAAGAALGAGATAVVVQGTPSPHDDAELRRQTPDAIGPLSPEAARERLGALSASGRADVVIAANGDLFAAARLVRRGGAIAAVVPPTTRPTVTTIVQRELTLPATRDLVPAEPAGRPERAGVRTTEGADHGH